MLLLFYYYCHIYIELYVDTTGAISYLPTTMIVDFVCRHCHHQLIKFILLFSFVFLYLLRYFYPSLYHHHPYSQPKTLNQTCIVIRKLILIRGIMHYY